MAIQSLLNPRSIAIVGASDKIGPGFNAWNALDRLGYSGQIYLVNPGKSELFGYRTYPSLAAIDGSIDAAFLAVRAESIIEVAQQAATQKVGALAILSSGFSDAGPAGLERQHSLSTVAKTNDMAVCGPNCLGLLNFSTNSALFGTSLPDTIRRGGIAAIVQSGSVGIALLNSSRELGLSHLITSGNEAVTTTADYLEALIDDDTVKVIVVFAEQIRNPTKFMAMSRRSNERGKPLIVLKTGRSESGRAASMAHTGAVAGSAEACDAALAANGAIQVHTLDELLETAVLTSRLRHRPTARKVAMVSLSGGEIAVALDTAEEKGVEFAPIDAAQAEITALLPEFAHISNPLDLTWAGLYDMNVAQGCARALAGQEDVGALILLQDAPSGLGPQQASRYASLFQAVAAGAEAAGKPFLAISNLSEEPHPQLKAAANESGHPYLRGTSEGLTAIASYTQWASASRPMTPAAFNKPSKADTEQRLKPFLAGRMPAEHEARAIMAGYGIAGPSERFVATSEDAAQAANELGFPIVLKGVVANLIHKSDAGLVALRLNSAEAVRTAAETMTQRLAADGQASMLGLLVQKMMPGIAEILVGARVDPDFGPLIVVGAGGVNIELYRDVAVDLAPIDPAGALKLLRRTKIAKTLEGWRGAPVGDMDETARIISAVSHFIFDFSDQVAEIEINPLAVFERGQGCAALDCVLVPHPI